MQVLIAINDASLPGVTAARAAYNATLPAEIEVTPAVPASEGAEAVPAVMGPNPVLITTDADYIVWVVGRAVESWNRQHATVPEAPPAPPVVVSGVPQQVTRRQAKTLMELTPNAAHGNLWQAALAAANAIPDAQTRVVTVNYLMESLHFEYPRVLAMASQLLGMTAPQVDAVFIAADKL